MSSPPKLLCERMNHWLSTKKKDPAADILHPYASLETVEACSCPLCQCIYAVFSKDSKDEHGEQNQLEVRKEKEVQVEFMGSGLNILELCKKAKYDVFVLEPHKIDAIPLCKTIPGSTASDESFLAITDWLADCMAHHKIACRDIRRIARLPKRVIDVKSLEESNCVRLVEDCEERAHYICLSHCWGGPEHQPLRTTLNPDTLTEFKKSIPVDMLPKTFQDAVHYTRRLAVQYLWIDSLCIIQDSEEDWREQSSKMADIYQCTFLTLAASAAPDSRHGLYSTADPIHKDQALDTITGNEHHQGIRIRSKLLHASADLPLMTRAWVLQERLLTPRMLHFCRNELILECLEKILCECGWFKPERTWAMMKAWDVPKSTLSKAYLENAAYDSVVDVWHKIVADYSKLHLSHEKDIFPAVSGIAKQFKKARGWVYVAGLWSENLIWDLCWATNNPRRCTRPRDWRAPSFSWASVVSSGNGTDHDPIEFLKGTRRLIAKGYNWTIREHIRVLDFRCDTVGEDEMGQVKSGVLVVSGQLFRETLICLHAHPRRRHVWDLYSADDTDTEASYRYRPDYNYTSDSRSLVTSGSTVYCLRVLSRDKNQKYDNRKDAWLLVLRKVSDQDSPRSELPSGKREEEGDVYERIGLYLSERDEHTNFDEDAQHGKDEIIRII